MKRKRWLSFIIAFAVCVSGMMTSALCVFADTDNSDLNQETVYKTDDGVIDNAGEDGLNPGGENGEENGKESQNPVEQEPGVEPEPDDPDEPEPIDPDENIPADVVVKSMKSKFPEVVLKWNAVKCTGYVIRISTNKAFKSQRKYYVKKAKTNTYKFKGLKDGKRYFAEIKAYNKVGSKKYYSMNWSRLKAVTAKTSGWLKIKGRYFYFRNSEKLRGTKKIDGSRYYFAPNGEVKGFSKKMWNKAKRSGSRTKWMIVVDKKINRMCIYRKYKRSWIVRKLYICSVGTSATPTPSGNFETRVRVPSFGDDFTCWYATAFIRREFLIHSSPYYKGSKTRIMDSRLGIPTSHGCIRVSLANAKWIYKNIPLKSRLLIY